MRGVQNIYHRFYIFSYFLVFVLFRSSFSTHFSTLSSTDCLTISSNRTIVSRGDVFELGFFKPSSKSRWYIGIWYKKISKRVYVWVANRDKPLTNPIGTFKISDTNLVILDHSDKIVWSTNLTKRCVDSNSSVVVELLSNGNLVMRSSKKNEEYLWQSFDFPTDTLLPEMKLGSNKKTGLDRFLTSWKSLDDPAPGEFMFKLESRSFAEFVVRNHDISMYRTGPWNGNWFSGIPEMRKLDCMVHNFIETKEEISYTFLITNHNIYSQFTMSHLGSFILSTWNPTSLNWNSLLSLPKESCDLYQRCGPYSYCETNKTHQTTCNCLRGFEPKVPHSWESKDWSHGCVRKTSLKCEDKFITLSKMKLPDTSTAVVDKRIGIKECMNKCLNDCNCTAYANADIRNGGSGCVIWTGELVDIRNISVGGQDLYVRSCTSTH